MCRTLARGLVDRGHEVEVFTEALGNNRGEKDDDGIRLHRLSCGRRTAFSGPALTHVRFAIAAWAAVWRCHRQKPFNLVHAHFIFPAGITAMLVAGHIRVPYVVTAHGSDVPGHNPLGHDRLLRLVMPLWQRVVRHAHRVVSPSEYLLGRITTAAAAELAGNVIPNGVTLQSMNDEPGEKRRQVLFVGRLIRIKAVDILIAAARELPPGWAVDVVGEGPELADLETRASNSPVPIRFHGRVDHDDPVLARIYKEAAIFAFPAHSENFSVVLLEAMAASCAILTVAAGGNCEVVGNAARVVMPGDVDAFRKELRVLAETPELRDRLGRLACRRLREEFSSDLMAQRYEALFDDVLGNGSGR